MFRGSLRNPDRRSASASARAVRPFGDSCPQRAATASLPFCSPSVFASSEAQA